MENPYRFFADKDKKGNWRYFEAKTYLLELQVSHALVAMAKKESTLSYTDKECDDLIKDYENDNEIELGEEQKEAVKKTLKNRVSIITGGPGRGKTTIEDIIIKGWKAKGGKTILLAPTGRAAQRMTQATEEEAKTIQRKLLAYETGCDEESYFLPTLVLVDEMSMCTLQLLARLINFSKAGDIHFTFIGDANQLPCIGLGDVFKDMIKSGLIPCTKLLKCYRNAGAISYNSDIINNGGMMRDFKKDNTFKLVTMESVESVQETIINLYGKMKERFKPDEIGIIVPCRKSGKTCANELNRLIQEKYNLFTGKKNEIHYKDKLFRVNDRIIHTRNCYNMQYEDRYGIGLGVFNGETGTITKIDPYAKIIYVQFDGDDEKQVIYDFEHMKFLELAYAITVHKAQGSEYKCVISAFVNGDYNLLCRNMIYTAETRAKELMILLGSNKAIAMAISNAYVEDDNGVHNYLSSNSSRDKLVYACLQRNRDENGNGRIDAAEVKWYPAAINQLTDIWMGKDALPSEAHLYQNGDVKYRRYLSSDGQELYAEEGSSIGGYKFTYANSLPGSISAPTRYDYRCVRNLGMSEGVPAKTTIPQPYVQHDERGKMFTLTYMASVSVRGVGDFATDELANHTELDLTNRPYLKFEYKDAENISLTWEQVNRLVDQHKSPCAKYNTGGQIGWRLPNQRELSIMAAWCDNTGWGGSTHCQTRTGASPFMTGKGSTSGHSGGYHFMTLPSGGFKGPVRCVRDVK